VTCIQGVQPNEITMLGPAPLVLCGPSGAGKSTLLKQLMKEIPDRFGFSVSHTTRTPREGEVHGEAYFFVTREEMEGAVGRGEFIEHATFAGNMYGTSTAAVRSVMEKGLICVLDIDIQGVQSLKKTDIHPNYVFIMPPSLDILKERLLGRGTETEDSLSRRLEAAKEDMEYGQSQGNFHIVILNDNLSSAYTELLTFVKKQYPDLN